MNEGNGGERRWRVPIGLVFVKAGAALAFAVLAAASQDDRPFLVLAAVAAIGLAGLALRDVVAPVRVVADAEGVTVVTGFAGHRHLPWPSVQEMRVDERRRVLIHTRLLEIETHDDLYLFSAFDLGQDVREVLDELLRLRAHAEP